MQFYSYSVEWYDAEEDKLRVDSGLTFGSDYGEAANNLSFWYGDTLEKITKLLEFPRQDKILIVSQESIEMIEKDLIY